MKKPETYYTGTFFSSPYNKKTLDKQLMTHSDWLESSKEYRDSKSECLKIPTRNVSTPWSTQVPGTT